MNTMNAEIKSFRVNAKWSFDIVLGTGKKVRIFRTRYAPLFETRLLALQTAISHLDFLADKVSMYVLPENVGWTWELWAPAFTDEPNLIIEPVGLNLNMSYGAAQGEGLRWAKRLGLEMR